MRVARALCTTLFACHAGIVGCAVGADEPPPPGEEHRVSAAGAPVAQQSASADLPLFVAGTYDLVLERGEPIFDDSVVVQALVEGYFEWSLLDQAQSLGDTLTGLATWLQRTPRNSDLRHDLGRAETSADSAVVVRRFLGLRSCEEWRVGATVELREDGGLDRTIELREYCRGRSPAITRRHATEPSSQLQACESVGPPVAGLVLHVTCGEGRWWNGMYRYRYAGDTLILGSDCDGEETYVLRPVGLTMPVQVARTSDVEQLHRC